MWENSINRWDVSEVQSLGVLAGILLVKEYATCVKFHTGCEI
jgi:hypothetical protein